MKAHSRIGVCMKFNKQLVEYDPVNKIFGDCMRTAIRCILNLRPEDVPPFGEYWILILIPTGYTNAGTD
jgi:hypothetical protein